MAPPAVSPVNTGSPPEKPAVDPAVERQDTLSADKIITDPRWSDPTFRGNHLSLYKMVVALGKFMAGKGTEEDLQKRIEEWKDSPEYSQDPALSETVLKNIYAQLRKFQAEENIARAVKAREFLPEEPRDPEPEIVAEPEPAPKTPEKKGSKDTYSPGWQFGALTFDTHFADEALRPASSVYSLGVIPKQGFNQNLTSQFGWALGAQFNYNYLNFFSGIYQEDMTPTKSAAHYNRMGLRLGLVEYGGFYGGKRGPGGGFHGGLVPRKRVGMELGAAWCTGIDYADLTGVECPDSSFQLGVINQTDFLSAGYGPFELNVSLLPGKFYGFQGDALDLPQLNRVPLELGATWHFNPPPVPGDPETPEEVVNPKTKDAEVGMTAFTMLADGVSNHVRAKQEAAFELSRPLFFGDRSQFTLLNVGSTMSGIFNGWAEGSLGFRLSKNLRYGNKGQRIGLGVLMGVELGVNLIGVAATPGTPDNIQTFPGQTVPPDADLSNNEALANLDGRAFRLRWPTVATRDGLALLGAVGAFGDRGKAIQGEGFHAWYYPTIHGALGVAGLAMVLTSGNGSGEGFFGQSILGNQPPPFNPGDTIELNDTDYNLTTQAGNYHQLQIGTAVLSYGVNGVLDYLSGVGSYNKLKACQDEPYPGCKNYQEEKASGSDTAFVKDLRVGAKVGQEGASLSLSGKF